MKNLTSSENKKVNNCNSSKNKTNIIYNQDEPIHFQNNIKKEENTKKNKINYHILNNINQKTIKNYYQNNLNMNNNINDNLSFYYKYINYDKNSDIRKSLEKTNSAPNIFFHNAHNSSDTNRKNSISNYLKKIKDEQNALITKKNNYNFYNKDNSFNNPKNNNIIFNYKTNLKKLPFNITNNAFNINKNNINISLNANILGDNLNIEKYMGQQKLSDYKSLIYKKIEQLMKNQKSQINKNRDKSCSIEKIKIIAPKPEYSTKTSKVISNSDFKRNRNKKNDKFSKTYIKNINDDNYKGKNNKINIVPTKRKDYEKKIIYNPIMYKENLTKNKLKKNVKGKIYLDSYNEMMIRKNV